MKPGHICARTQLIPQESTHKIKLPVLSVFACSCGFKRGISKHGISDIPLSILWHKSVKTNLFLSPSFSVSHKHTYLNKQRDAGLSCSIVVSGKLRAPVEALLDCFWIEYGSRPIPWSSVPQSATCLIILSISLWDEEQTICTAWQIAHLKCLDVRAHFPVLLLKVKGDIPFTFWLIDLRIRC